MRIHELADRKGKAGHWSSYDTTSRLGISRREIFHYNTRMLEFQLGDDGLWNGDPNTVNYSIGHGSVSDQNGMNNLFARCAMHLVYRRDIRGGGARIETLEGLPHYRYGITREDMYSRKVRTVTHEEAMRTWPIRMVQTTANFSTGLTRTGQKISGSGLPYP